MVTVGPNSFTTFAGVVYGTAAWLNPANAEASDNVYATVVLFETISYYLKATGAGFSIPAGATILGIYAQFERKTTGATVSDSSIKIVKADSIGGTEHSAGAAWSTTEAYVGFGGASDLWGLTWTPDDINAATFGVAIAAAHTSGVSSRTASIDHIRITVYYELKGQIIVNTCLGIR